MAKQQQAAKVHSWLRHACNMSGTPGLTSCHLTWDVCMAWLFSIQGQKQGLLDYFAMPRPRTPLAGQGLEDSISVSSVSTAQKSNSQSSCSTSRDVYHKPQIALLSVKMMMTFN